MSFTENVMEDLKKKGLTDKSIALYIKNLKNINGKEDFSNFNFLKKVDDVNAFLHKFKPSTRKSYIGCIISVLGLFPTNKVLTNLKNKYFILFNDENAKLKESVNEKTETQKENWIDWNDVLKIWEDARPPELLKKVQSKKGVKEKKSITFPSLTETEYTKLLNFMVLSLYVLIPPRRNEDYLKMVISLEGDADEAMEDKTKNYLDLKNKQFVFNSFKTSKQYPNSIEKIPDDLMNIIDIYLKHYPKTIETGSPFLVFSDGERLDKINVITRILNKMFKKNVGVSMLRHSYLTHKYGDINKEKEVDAKAMGHSLATQNTYVKKDETP
jgi:integrase